MSGRFSAPLERLLKALMVLLRKVPRVPARRRSWGLIGVGFALVLTAVPIVRFAPSASAALSDSGAGFEFSDGNLAPSTGGFDWNSFAPVNWNGCQDALTPPCVPYRTAQGTATGTYGDTSGKTWSFAGFEDSWNQSGDTSFKGGTKQDTQCPTVINSGVPNKDDDARLYLATAKGASGDVYLSLAWVRGLLNTTSSSAFVGFEFNQAGSQASDYCGASSSTPSVNLPKRKGGDMLVVYNFTGGNVAPDILLYRWLTTAWVGTNTSYECAATNSSISTGCWGGIPSQEDITATGVAVAQVNEGTTPVTDSLCPPSTSSYTTPGYTSNGTTSGDCSLGQYSFGEAGIDLTAAGVFSSGTCTSFGSAQGETRSSGNSNTAAQEDLVGPGPFTISNCGRIVVKKTDNATTPAPLTGATFTVTPGSTSGSTTAESTTLSPVSGAPGYYCADNLLLSTSSYTVTETSPPPGYSVPDPNSQTVAAEPGTCSTVTSSTTADLTFVDTPITIATSATPSVTVGGTIQDVAYLTGANNPTGTISFQLYSDSACTQLVTSYGTNGTDTEGEVGTALPTVTVGGTSYPGETSATFETSTAGTTYYWIASYSGDANNSAVSGKCGDANESSTVNKASPSASTNIILKDTVALSGAVGSVSGDKVDFSLYKGDSTCSVAADLVTLSNSATVDQETLSSTGTATTSASYTVPVGGSGSTYYWKAYFEGDSNNNASTSCNESALVTYTTP